MTSWIMIVGAALAALVTLNPRLLRAPLWRATVTPLASIIGSGFLIAGPILAEVAGRWAFAAMAALCAVGWLFGSAVRHTIREAEPRLRGKHCPVWLRRMERLSDLALALAYFVSVAYYLNLFAAFGLRIAGTKSPESVRWLSVAIIALLGLIGSLRGLRWLENIELPAVGVKLALIGALLLALFWADGSALVHGTLSVPPMATPDLLHASFILMGLIVMVQGFETSRYLGASYDGPTRIRTMRAAQLISTAIYIPFILLMTPFFAQHPPHGAIEETAIIDQLRPLGWALAPLVILLALASQLSAAVADMNGAGGLVHSASRQRIGVRWGYAATASVAILITLSANIFEIIAYASKAFVLYYGLQSATAARLCLTGDERQTGRFLAYAAAVLIAGAIILLGAPASA